MASLSIEKGMDPGNTVWTGLPKPLLRMPSSCQDILRLTAKQATRKYLMPRKREGGREGRKEEKEGGREGELHYSNHQLPYQ